MVLHGPGNDFRGRGGIVIHQNDERNGDALIAADCVIPMILRRTAVVRNDQLIFLEKHIADGDGFVQ